MITNLVLCQQGSPWVWYKVYYENGIYIGDFMIGDDGYYYYWPEHHDGCLDSYHLFDIHQNLEALNKEWNEIVQKELNAS